MKELLKSINLLITADNIALLSMAITLLVFILSRRSELKYKKHDDRKVQYIKLIKLMEQFIIGGKKDSNGEMQISDDLKKQFFDSGASLLLYGSKALYRQYLLFREFSSNPLVRYSKYYENALIIYVIADVLKTMRKEVGLSTFSNIHANEALGFFVNEITNNPNAKNKAHEAKFRIKMIRFELFMMDRTKLVFGKGIFFKYIKPLFAALPIMAKYILFIPLGGLLKKLFPEFFAKVQDQSIDAK